MPALNDYFCYVTGDSGLSLQIPHELYVRKSTAFFELLHPTRTANLMAESLRIYTFYRWIYGAARTGSVRLEICPGI